MTWEAWVGLIFGFSLLAFSLGIWYERTRITNALQADRGYRDTVAVEIASAGVIKAKQFGPFAEHV
jgi:hypothetical protein